MEPRPEDKDDALPLFPHWPIRHERICLKGITRVRRTPLSALVDSLVPGCLRRLHLEFNDWSHLDEMGRVFQHFGDTITEFAITCTHALSMHHLYDGMLSDEEWASYNFSALRNLNKLRFELSESLTALNPPKKEPEWTAIAGVPRLLACFSRDLPLRDGIEIDVAFEESDCTFSGRPRPSTSLRPEIELALLRFDNLNRVTLRSKYTCDLDVARAIGAAAFPTLLEAGKEIRVVQPDMHECCWQIYQQCVFDCLQESHLVQVLDWDPVRRGRPLPAGLRRVHRRGRHELSPLKAPVLATMPLPKAE
ncbi:hypothetical protein K466DRAFT_314755 [Polyporus arcularius HHB13444]|uniref:Uncharacterized protein n=1 Tax=Polyporus arcularius HHB13444 TaxID=1314778 RepID=A0A5C3P0E9_9APHY|nr:hypothetical protein K466DRAFT_314755 [Polyporus arcularius HHB13444]